VTNLFIKYKEVAETMGIMLITLSTGVEIL
jgi:hypothetical protein